MNGQQIVAAKLSKIKQNGSTATRNGVERDAMQMQMRHWQSFAIRRENGMSETRTTTMRTRTRTKTRTRMRERRRDGEIRERVEQRPSQVNDCTLRRTSRTSRPYPKCAQSESFESSRVDSASRLIISSTKKQPQTIVQTCCEGYFFS